MRVPSNLLVSVLLCSGRDGSLCLQKNRRLGVGYGIKELHAFWCVKLAVKGSTCYLVVSLQFRSQASAGMSRFDHDAHETEPEACSQEARD